MMALPLILFPAMVIVAAMRDVTTFTIPNWISFAGILAFFPVALLVQAPLGVIEGSTIAGVAALAVGVLMFSLGWIGGGDAKLFAACAFWMGWPAVMPFIIWTSLAGGVLAVSLMVSRKMAAGYAGFGPAWFGRLMQEGGEVPYGLAIAAGALIAFPSSGLAHL